MLTVVSVLTAMAAPSASRALDRARISRAVEDAEAIKTAIVNFGTNLPGYRGFTVDGGSASNTSVQLAVSDGDIPREVSLSGDARWTHPVDAAPAGGFLVVDFLENHLVLNDPFGGGGSDGYPLAGGNTWRGAYINAPIDGDPWGNRYAVNVDYLQLPANRNHDVAVLSAGPDEQIDTRFEVDGLSVGDDDVMVVIARHQDTPCCL